MVAEQMLGLPVAAIRVHRSRRTIRRWMAEGMPHHWYEGRKFVLESDLLAAYREHLLAEKRNQFSSTI
jgi:hypothetical protein